MKEAISETEIRKLPIMYYVELGYGSGIYAYHVQKETEKTILFY